MAEIEAQNAAMMEMLAEMKAERAPAGEYQMYSGYEPVAVDEPPKREVPKPFTGGPYGGGGDALTPLVEMGIVDDSPAPPRRGRPPKSEAA
jgi:hypothetical protein